MKNILRARGFTLIEMMIAMTLGLLLLAGLATLVVQTSRSNTNQQALARLQENGRFAMSKIISDIRMAGAQYCSSYANIFPVAGHNRNRSFSVLADGAMPYGFPTRTQIAAVYGPTLSNALPYPVSTRYLLQGHECTTDFNCNPVLTITGAADPRPPTPGMADGSRARAADVLTLRYLSGPGVPLAADYAGGPAAVTVNSAYSPAATAAPLSFAPGELALITDCSSAQIFEASYAGNVITPNDSNDAGGTHNDVGGFTASSDARVFNFNRDFLTVTYFLQLRTDRDDQAGVRRISSLVRQVNGATQLITDGVERLEFRYGVEGVDGRVRYLTADQVNSGTDCTPFPTGLKTMEPGCLWRSVRAIDVALLVNSVLADAPSERERYSFTFDNQIEVEAPATLPSGLPRGRVFRREFRTTVTLRNSGI